MLALIAAAIVYHATVLKVVDGDTLQVSVDGWPAPFTPIDVRVYGIDTPEKRRPPAKSACEVALGVKASAFAHSLVKPGEAVSVSYTIGRRDKYGRLLGAVTLPDGRDWASTIISAKLGRPYGQNGKLTKLPWC